MASVLPSPLGQRGGVGGICTLLIPQMGLKRAEGRVVPMPGEIFGTVQEEGGAVGTMQTLMNFVVRWQLVLGISLTSKRQVASDKRPGNHCCAAQRTPSTICC